MKVGISEYLKHKEGEIKLFVQQEASNLSCYQKVRFDDESLLLNKFKICLENDEPAHQFSKKITNADLLHIIEKSKF